jgi:redox-sensitive bicupin YhaK (pirin superfamily)
MADSPTERITLVSPRTHRVGGFDVSRTLPTRQARAVGPFVFLDHMGPARLAPGEGFDVAPHPHIGLSTVTFLFDGAAVHRDSLGTVQPIAPGALNVMAAGRGVVHSERTPEELRAAGPSMHGLQLWLAEPREREDAPPRFSHHARETLPTFARPGVEGTVLFGAAYGVRSPADHALSPLLVVARIEAGASLALPDDVGERAVHVVSGAVRVDGLAVTARALALCGAAEGVVMAAEADAVVAILGGPRMPEPRYMDWNFVATSPERLARARDDWRAGRFATIPGDDQERIEYPDFHPPSGSSSDGEGKRR